MIVMVANQCGGFVHYLAGTYPAKIGWLFSPGGFKEPRHWLPYAIDNGKFACWNSDRVWNEDGFFALLDRCKLSKHKPMWVAVPDEVGNKEETRSLWDRYERRVRQYGWPAAFVVQDGMTPRDVPESADVVFVGGSSEWKWRHAATFCAAFPRVHIGRVNWVDKLEHCDHIGAESCDGTGFFRGGEGSQQALQLEEFLGGRRRHNEQNQLFDYGNSLATSQSPRAAPAGPTHLEFYHAQHALDADTKGKTI